MMKRFSLSVLCAFASVCLFAEKQPLERYQTIIDRHPFGQPPAGFDPQKMASEASNNGDGQGIEEQLTAQQEEIQRAISFNMVNVETDGSIMVGFSDRLNPKGPKHYYLAVGERQDGWHVKAVDPIEETMTIEKDEVETVVKLGENPQNSAKGKAIPGVPQRNVANSASPALLSSRPANSSSVMSYSSRRKLRREEEAKAKAAQEAREQELKRAQEERAAREAAEKEAREQEKAEMRQQMQSMQDQLKKVREKQEKAQKESQQANEESSATAE